MLSEYVSYLVEYDIENNVVYISGLDTDGFYNQFLTQTDIAEPESYAWGYADALAASGRTAEVENVTE